jgi:hypothetical protein
MINIVTTCLAVTNGRMMMMVRQIFEQQQYYCATNFLDNFIDLPIILLEL